MADVKTYTINQSINSNTLPISKENNSNDSLILEAHTSANMKVKKPKITADTLYIAALNTKKPYSDKEATKRIQAINTDIYEKSGEEKEKHKFNFKRYFTIFGIIALITTIFSFLNKKK